MAVTAERTSERSRNADICSRFRGRSPEDGCMLRMKDGHGSTPHRVALGMRLALVIGAIGACNGALPICAVGEVQFCPCETSLAGVRQCEEGGFAWSRCACGSLHPFTCGNGLCEVSDRFDCPQDCPVRCGDDVCAPSETAASCASDCTWTSACARDEDCPSGQHCAARACDRARGCFPNDASQGFEIVGEVRRPARCNWEPCTPGAGQCGPLAECAVPPGGTTPMCSHRCESGNDCAPVPRVPAVAVCHIPTHRCVLRCSASARCPVEYACETVENDVMLCR